MNLKTDGLEKRRLWIDKQRKLEGTIRWGLFFCIGVSLLTTVSIILILAGEGWQFFRQVPLRDFLGNTSWTPLFEPKSFGIWPLISGTLLVSFIAIAFALPLGLAGAVFLSEYIRPGWSKIIKPILEILAGIPTIIYGYFALSVVTPALRQFLPELNIFNALSAGLVMGLMILPLVTSLCQDAMLAVPSSMRSGGYALGATKAEVIRYIILPSAISGIAAAVILALSRAIGETMLVTIAAGSTPTLTLNPQESIQTMTAYIAQVSLGETPHGTLVYQTIFAVGLVLFLITLLMNILSQYIVRRFEERYV